MQDSNVHRRQFIVDIVSRFSRDASRLLDILWSVQKGQNYISLSDMQILASQLSISVPHIQEVVSFYHFFRSEPSGKHVVYIDSSIIAEHAGMAEVQATFLQELSIDLNQVSHDGFMGVFTTSCIGMSDQAPAALIDGYPFPRLTPAKVKKIIQALRDGISAKELAVGEFAVHNNIIHSGPYLLHRIKQSVSHIPADHFTPEQILEKIKKSRLRGRGGAGFSTGKKWELCKRYKARGRFVVCNADEGEPGTFKDRVLLTEASDLLFEGMYAAAKAIEAKEGIIYLRAEYFYLLENLESAIKQFSQKNKFHQFNLRVQLGAGAYVCGEESALLESMEGKRGEPRLKPPFPVESGYLGCPTVVNNVETFVLAAQILRSGEDEFRHLGTEQSRGVRLLSISGDVQIAGIYEVPWGVSVAEVLKMCQAQDPWMIQVGGPSGICLSIDDQSRKLSFEDVPTGGSFMVFSKKRDLFKIWLNFMDFFVEESCGNCAPCRAGNVILRELLSRFSRGQARREDLQKLDQWAQVVMRTSRCGLGKTSPLVLTSSKAAFSDIYEASIDKNKSDLFYDFDLKVATRDYDDLMREQKQEGNS